MKVFADRWGERENHSYIVGVFSKKYAAIKCAQEEELYRGGNMIARSLSIRRTLNIQDQRTGR